MTTTTSPLPDLGFVAHYAGALRDGRLCILFDRGAAIAVEPIAPVRGALPRLADAHDEAEAVWTARPVFRGRLTPAETLDVFGEAHLDRPHQARLVRVNGDAVFDAELVARGLALAALLDGPTIHVDLAPIVGWLGAGASSRERVGLLLRMRAGRSACAIISFALARDLDLPDVRLHGVELVAAEVL